MVKEHIHDDKPTTRIYYNEEYKCWLLKVGYMEDFDDIKYIETRYSEIRIEFCPFCGKELSNGLSVLFDNNI